ncbi:zinc-binding metallopeptidase family protein [Acidimangrovimonas sediminis]|uniref:zinc-binding metallopeptidase family protein n=1 Tax=Acidimangrovimonas sediminis TaxID=2056283 RepID=UPI000C7FD391|nr:putative zinc-binding metallopeptidase [Acidimangrovimonas sediminis]
MRLFQCQCCGQVLHFENTACLNCGRDVGYLPGRDAMAAVEAEGPVWHLAEGSGPNLGDTSGRYRFCANWEMSGCNWLLDVGSVSSSGASADETYCRACRHNRTVPDLSDPGNRARWQKIETAKRRLIYTLRRLGLPMPLADDGHPEPMIFDFLADGPDPSEQVTTGHADGVITIALTEADDAHREKLRQDMGEGYRTLLGHFRHEIGHYYWDLLIRDGSEDGGTTGIEAFRALFGDERADYGAALQAHYRDGPPADWQASHVSAYATMHPWEDWAETWAHYLHMVDTIETATAFGMSVAPRIDPEGKLSAELDFDPYRALDIRQLVTAWMPLTVALNAMNRAMGQQDFYPFVLPEPVQAKLAFVHAAIRTRIAPA